MSHRGNDQLIDKLIDENECECGQLIDDHAYGLCLWDKGSDDSHYYEKWIKERQLSPTTLDVVDPLLFELVEELLVQGLPVKTYELLLAFLQREPSRYQSIRMLLHNVHGEWNKEKNYDMRKLY